MGRHGARPGPELLFEEQTKEVLGTLRVARSARVRRRSPASSRRSRRRRRRRNSPGEPRHGEGRQRQPHPQIMARQQQRHRATQERCWSSAPSRRSRPDRPARSNVIRSEPFIVEGEPRPRHRKSARDWNFQAPLPTRPRSSTSSRASVGDMLKNVEGAHRLSRSWAPDWAARSTSTPPARRLRFMIFYGP